MKTYDFESYVPSYGGNTEIYIKLTYKNNKGEDVTVTLYTPVKALREKNSELIFKRHWDYNNDYYHTQPELKEKILGVPEATINEYGVVSSEVAAAMAEGARNLTGSTYAVSTTGLAGPGGDEHNPVGTVWIGIAGPNGTKTVKKVYKNDRKRNIERFAAAALDELRLFMLSDRK